MLNTVLIPTLPTENVACIALWHANQALRAGRAAKQEHAIADKLQPGSKTRVRAEALEYERDVYANKMYDILEAAKYPRLATQVMVRALGRSKALVLKIERPIINLALQNA